MMDASQNDTPFGQAVYGKINVHLCKCVNVYLLFLKPLIISHLYCFLFQNNVYLSMSIT